MPGAAALLLLPLLSRSSPLLPPFLSSCCGMGWDTLAFFSPRPSVQDIQLEMTLLLLWTGVLVAVDEGVVVPSGPRMWWCWWLL